MNKANPIKRKELKINRLNMNRDISSPSLITLHLNNKSLSYNFQYKYGINITN